MIKRLSAFIISATVSVYLILPSFAEDGKDYIKWIDFDVTAQALRDTASVDCESHGSENEYPWINLLSVLAVKYGGDFSRYRKADLDEICDRLASGCDYTEVASNEKLYNYYLDAYGAVLGGMLGDFGNLPLMKTVMFTMKKNTEYRSFPPSHQDITSTITTISALRAATATREIISVTISWVLSALPL